MASGESSDINGKEYKILLYVPDVEVAQLNVDTCLYEPFLTAYLDDEEDDEEDDPEAENEDDSEASGLYLLSEMKSKNIVLVFKGYDRSDNKNSLVIALLESTAILRSSPLNSSTPKLPLTYLALINQSEVIRYPSTSNSGKTLMRTISQKYPKMKESMNTFVFTFPSFFHEASNEILQLEFILAENCCFRVENQLYYQRRESSCLSPMQYEHLYICNIQNTPDNQNNHEVTYNPADIPPLPPKPQHLNAVNSPPPKDTPSAISGGSPSLRPRSGSGYRSRPPVATSSPKVKPKSKAEKSSGVLGKVVDFSKGVLNEVKKAESAMQQSAEKRREERRRNRYIEQRHLYKSDPDALRRLEENYAREEKQRAEARARKLNQARSAKQIGNSSVEALMGLYKGGKYSTQQQQQTGNGFSSGSSGSSGTAGGRANNASYHTEWLSGKVLFEGPIMHKVYNDWVQRYIVVKDKSVAIFSDKRHFQQTVSTLSSSDKIPPLPPKQSSNTSVPPLPPKPSNVPALPPKQSSTAGLFLSVWPLTEIESTRIESNIDVMHKHNRRNVFCVQTRDKISNFFACESSDNVSKIVGLISGTTGPKPKPAGFTVRPKTGSSVQATAQLFNKPSTPSPTPKPTSKAPPRVTWSVKKSTTATTAPPTSSGSFAPKAAPNSSTSSTVRKPFTPNYSKPSK